MTQTTILFLHGHTLDNRMWQPQILAFQNQFQIFAPNLRGYGSTAASLNSFSYAKDMLELLEQHNLKKVHLVGLSLGGNIALEMAIRFPTRITSLSLLDTSLKGFAPDAAQLEVGQRVNEAFIAGGLQAARATWLAAPLFAAALENPNLKSQLEQWVNEYSGWHWQQNISPSNNIAEITAQLHQIQVKTLIILGARDTNYFRGIAEHLQNTIANSSLKIIPKAGHLVNLEQPEMVNTLLGNHFRTD